MVDRRGRRPMPHPVRRLGQARQHQGTVCPPRRGRRARWRREPRRRGIRQDHSGGCSIGAGEGQRAKGRGQRGRAEGKGEGKGKRALTASSSVAKRYTGVSMYWVMLVLYIL